MSRPEQRMRQRERLKKTAIDHLVITVIPILIMFLVGSLVYFLIEVFYQGQYQARLNYIFAWFVLAIVLIARLSMTEGIEYAMLFAFPLALVTGMAMFRFVEIRGMLSSVSWLVNAILMAIVWWSAHKLTWDCTLIDESQDASGEGLLQTVGLDDANNESVDKAEGSAPTIANGEVEASESNRATSLGFWQRFVEKQKRPHAPGVWVVYFSLASLPLFGIGQLFIPAFDRSRRQYVFFLLAIYVASGLALLVATSFLGLRRYLRQRRVEMPDEMSGAWLAGGGIMIVIVMTFCLFLPRPGAALSISRLPVAFGAPSGHEASDSGRGRDGDEDDQRKRSGEPESERERESSDSDSNDGRSHDKDTDEGSSEPENDDSNDVNGQSGEQSSSQKNVQQDNEDNPTSKSQSAGSGGNAEKSSESSQSQPPHRTSQTRTSPSNVFSFANIFKWIFYAILAAVVAYLTWRYRTQLIEGWLALLVGFRSWWANLWGKKKETTSQDVLQDETTTIRHRPFSSYSNPFRSQKADKVSTQELVRYTFDALEAWARESGFPRQESQTPHEFAHAVARRNGSLKDSVATLASLYSRAAFATGDLSRDRINSLRELWVHLESMPPI